MKPIHVFLRIHRGDHLGLGYLLGQGQLHKDAMHAWIGIEFRYQIEQAFFTAFSRQFMRK